MRDPEIACLSLRMCPRMDYSYALDTITGIPPFEDGTTWRWPEAEGDWGYPMSLDGHVFRTRSAHKGDIRVEICSNCHPFFTGRQKLVDTEGRVDRFQKKYQRAKEAEAKKKQPVA